MSAALMQRWVFRGVQIALGALLFVAGFTKFNNGWQFAELISNYRLLPAAGNQFVAIILPWCEISAGLMLVFSVWTRAAAILSALFFSAFAVAILAALARGLDIECGCFGTQAATTVGARALALDVAGLIASLYLVIRHSSASALDTSAAAG